MTEDQELRGGTLGPNALLVAYAMSRLDLALLDALGYGTWRQAYAAMEAQLGVRPGNLKALRDEFDVFFDNGRKGWRLRDPRPGRLAILHEFSEVGDAALLEIVRQVLANDEVSLQEIQDIVTNPPKRAANVAERLLTGRLAEEHFQRACQEILDLPATSLIDVRQKACGYDFGTTLRPDIAIEVKGLKTTSGGILFTDREWTEAQNRREDYCVVVVGNVLDGPVARVFRDPVHTLNVRCSVIQTTSTVWAATASVL